jgi:hypothetical protein
MELLYAAVQSFKGSKKVVHSKPRCTRKFKKWCSRQSLQAASAKFGFTLRSWV